MDDVAEFSEKEFKSVVKDDLANLLETKKQNIDIEHLAAGSVLVSFTAKVQQEKRARKALLRKSHKFKETMAFVGSSKITLDTSFGLEALNYRGKNDEKPDLKPQRKDSKIENESKENGELETKSADADSTANDDLGLYIIGLEDESEFIEAGIQVKASIYVDNNPLEGENYTWHSQVQDYDEHGQDGDDQLDFVFFEKHLFKRSIDFASISKGNVNIVCELLDENGACVAWTIYGVTEDSIQKDSGKARLECYEAPVTMPLPSSLLPMESRLVLHIQQYKKGEAPQKNQSRGDDSENGKGQATKTAQDIAQDMQNNKNKPWIFHDNGNNGSAHSVGKFKMGDGFDLYIDSGRFFPDDVAIVKVSVKVMTDTFDLVEAEPEGTEEEAVVEAYPELDEDVRSPNFNHRMEYRDDNFNPTSTVLIRVDGVNATNKVLQVVGYALLNVFVKAGTTDQPVKSDEKDFKLNAGAFQVPIRQGVPDMSTRLTGKSLNHFKKLPCATLTIRLVPAKKDASGVRVLSHRNTPLADIIEPPLGYDSGQYDSTRCQPSPHEKLLYSARQERRVMTMREGVELVKEDNEDTGRYI